MAPPLRAFGPHSRFLILLASLFAIFFIFTLYSDRPFEAGLGGYIYVDPVVESPLPRPPRFPDVPETSIPTVWDDTVPLIYTTAPGVKPGHVWLFGQGVLVDQSESLQCLLGLVVRPVVSSKRFWYSKFTTAFLCDLPPPGELEPGALLTILHRGEPVPSTARYHPKLFADSVDTYPEDKLDVAGPPRYGTCLVTQMRDMAYMVEEWVTYYRQIGVDHFYIYDNNSTDNLAGLYGSDHRDVEVIPWPWRRSQNQAYSHAMAFTRSRCHWTFYADVDYYLLPLTSPPTVQGIVAHVLGQYNCLVSSVVELRFEGVRPSHDNLLTCPNTSVIETYVHRRTDKDAYDLGFGLVMSSAADALHNIHFANLQDYHKSVKVARHVALGLHFSDRCWPQFYRQKCFGRGSIRDWDIPDDVDDTHPSKEWWALGKHHVVTDTRLRDFKRALGPAPPPLIRRAPLYRCGYWGFRSTQ